VDICNNYCSFPNFCFQLEITSFNIFCLLPVILKQSCKDQELASFLKKKYKIKSKIKAKAFISNIDHNLMTVEPFDIILKE